MTYMHKGKQYIVVPVGATDHPAEFVALALPDPKPITNAGRYRIFPVGGVLATLIKHKGHKGKPTGLILVSFVSFVLIQRRYTESKTDLAATSAHVAFAAISSSTARYAWSIA
ncbi:MAG: hypothetical protein AUH72_12855 [Acidobacteria bacterium 13_1_40CM_4_65_8]|nr:MAG: hypothetical protein AUH72_12855 [Acidobacteria bacterium 13_1_40CM_4_65_8]